MRIRLSPLKDYKQTLEYHQLTDTEEQQKIFVLDYVFKRAELNFKFSLF